MFLEVAVEQTSTRDTRLARVGNALFTVFNKFEESIELAARQGNMHPTDLRCIALLINKGEPISPKEIIAFLGLSSGSGTALLDRLENAGYVHRVRNPDDRRSVLVVLDEDAAADPIRLLRELQGRYRSGLEAFTDRDLDVVADYLDRMSELAVEARRPVGGRGRLDETA